MRGASPGTPASYRKGKGPHVRAGRWHTKSLQQDLGSSMGRNPEHASIQLRSSADRRPQTCTPPQEVDGQSTTRLDYQPDQIKTTDS